MEVVTILRSIKPIDAKTYKCPTIPDPEKKTITSGDIHKTAIGRVLYTDNRPLQERAYFFADAHTVVLGTYEFVSQLPGPDAETPNPAGPSNGRRWPKIRLQWH